VGLAAGLLWSTLSGVSHVPKERQDVVVSESEVAKQMAQVKKDFGEETEEFVRQFRGMTIRIKEYPVDAGASPDGRFVIRMFGREDTIASDLRHPGSGEAPDEFVRFYSYPSTDLTYSCSFARSTEDDSMRNVLFGVNDVNGDPRFSYLDCDADGLWDRFIDCTEEPSKMYARDGLCWKELTKDLGAGGPARP
jgi:hypothetical protein